MKTRTRLLKVDDLAEMLALSTRSVWRLVRDGQLPAPLRLGGSVRWREVEIEAALDKRAKERLRQTVQ